MAILYGTQSNGETLPVLVDQFGNLLAKGIEGEPGTPGEPGEPGEPGGAFPLPPGATDGALLGWQDGELVWVTEPVPLPVPGCAPVIYTGNGSTQTISGLNFSPDLVWVKNRTGAWSHVLSDSVRGSSLTLFSDSTGDEQTRSDGIVAFNADGFDVGPNDGITTRVTNAAGATYVAWCWDAGSSTVTNNDGTIESQVRSNGDFSVVSFTGSKPSNGSYGHGLNSAPAMIISKSTATSGWCVYHQSLAEGSQLSLQAVGGITKRTDAWISPPTSSVVNVGAWNAVNDSNPMIAYCWGETPGASNFSQYSGNGSRQTISTGFRPSLVMIKSTGDGNWFMFDNARGAANTLYANLTSAEADTGVIQFLDNGFQLLYGLPGVNQSDQTYIYAAFANPSDAAFAQRQLRREARQLERQQNETQPR